MLRRNLIIAVIVAALIAYYGAFVWLGLANTPTLG